MLPRPTPDRRTSGDTDHPTDEALAPLAHHLRDALTTVIGRAQLLTKRMVSDRAGPDDIVAGLEAVERAAWRMASDVERLEASLGPSRTDERQGLLGDTPDSPAANGARGGL